MGLIIPVVAAIWFAVLMIFCLQAAAAWWHMHQVFATVFTIRDPAVPAWRPIAALIAVMVVSNLLIFGCWWIGRPN
jgi:hypothetical protein